MKKEDLFKEYVKFFYKMKFENTQFYTPEQCEDINNGFRNKGLNIEIHSHEILKKLYIYLIMIDFLYYFLLDQLIYNL